MAGITALRTLRSRAILGRRVLIIGAAGGVGRYAIQLAALGGAHVIASVGSAAPRQRPEELRAHEVVLALEGIDWPVDLVLDNVGGPQLAAAWNLLAPGGGVQNIGLASDEPAVFRTVLTVLCRPVQDDIGRSKTMSTFGDVHGVGHYLATLLDFVATGRLSPDVDWRGSWERVTEAARALLYRHIAGRQSWTWNRHQPTDRPDSRQAARRRKQVDTTNLPQAHPSRRLTREGRFSHQIRDRTG